MPNNVTSKNIRVVYRKNIVKFIEIYKKSRNGIEAFIKTGWKFQAGYVKLVNDLNIKTAYRQIRI